MRPTRAVEILPPDASRTMYPAWAQARQDGIGGSDISVILGLSRWESPYGLWLTKTGRRPPIPDTGRMRRGRYLEPALAQWWADETGIGLRRTGTWVVDGIEWMRVNPDRLTSDGGVAEIKAPDPADWGDLWTDGPALHAAAQLMWEMAVLGAPHGYLIADAATGLRWWRLEYDDLVAQWMVDLGGAWWFRHVVADDPPPVDGSSATTVAIKQASAPPGQLAETVELAGAAALKAERAQLKETIAAATARLAEIENRLKAAARLAETITDGGDPVMSWQWVALNSTKVAPYRLLKEPPHERSSSSTPRRRRQREAS